MTNRIEDEIKDQLQRLAASTQRAKAFLAAQAARELVQTNEWQIAEIEAALGEADGEDFAGESDVAAVVAKSGADAR